LAEIERTKIALVETERKLEALTIEHGRVKGDYAALAVERSVLIVKQDDLNARIGDLERAVTTSEAASSEALVTLAERTAKLKGIERELEDNRLSKQSHNGGTQEWLGCIRARRRPSPCARSIKSRTASVDVESRRVAA
jgi:chromosome segregation ATPase